MVLRPTLTFGATLFLASTALAQPRPAQTASSGTPVQLGARGNAQGGVIAGRGLATGAPAPSSNTGAPNASAAPGTLSVPRTLAQALAMTYSSQPALQAERAKLRSTDETVPQALSGWRPQVVMAGTFGYGDGVSRAYTERLGIVNSRVDRDIATAQATVTQPLYTGGRTQANVNRARNQVMAERATLLGQEQTSFLNTVNAYVAVIQYQQVLALNINNEQVLKKQLQATNDRFRVGEITRTDVAQAQAALAGATAQRQVSEGNLATARGTFQQIIGVLPPTDLVEPQPILLPLKTEQDAVAMAAANNPNVIAALFNNAAAKDAVDVAFAQLLPQVSLQGQTFQQNNTSSRTSSANGYQAVVQLSVPVYQGGSEYSQVRQAKQSEQQYNRLVDDARATAVQNAVNAWETLVAARASADSLRSQIRANEVALEGVEREAIVGSRTTLDVLNAQQTLLSSRTNLVQSLAQVVNASFQMAASVGRLTARDMHLPVPLYDETAYYNEVKNKWGGLGDYATNQPGR